MCTCRSSPTGRWPLASSCSASGCSSGSSSSSGSRPTRIASSRASRRSPLALGPRSSPPPLTHSSSRPPPSLLSQASRVRSSARRKRGSAPGSIRCEQVLMNFECIRTVRVLVRAATSSFLGSSASFSFSLIYYSRSAVALSGKLEAEVAIHMLLRCCCGIALVNGFMPRTRMIAVPASYSRRILICSKPSSPSASQSSSVNLQTLLHTRYEYFLRIFLIISGALKQCSRQCNNSLSFIQCTLK